ncbi:2-nitropropane dioxygenase [Pontibacillus halophilus JSM 076056 = DSM 19796]|uniref:Probable nitronate monooxygenase n=1 Tax=Pontibacillus halophilus JSM 076056 = DSM 19796 TaxID=1385510 RepID=A0A0A5GK12_9BACI|nr:nitronate monooxygenase [Pontibacillus halophilus]KGX91533.1 2-nitropropane dioxygenase [Pontibacillus halophilus JSM 076056 = DSM 19796]
MRVQTRVTELLGIEYPILQGGLAHLAYSELASAVSNAGGLGQITAMSLEEPKRLREEILALQKKTTKPFGVNFAIGQHGRRYEEFLEVALEEQVPVLTITGGNPKPLLQAVEGKGIVTLVLVASVRQAIKAEELGADAVMVVGHEGGGHLGRDDVGTMVLTPSVVDRVDIPVIASGGISDGRGFMAALALGAEGIEMGTRFIATKECVHAHERYKQDLLASDSTSTTVIKRSLGTPARALSNTWTERILQLEKDEPGFSVLQSYIDGQANKRYIYDGDEQNGFGWAGQVAGRIHDVPSVQMLFSRIIEEASSIREKWGM